MSFGFGFGFPKRLTSGGGLSPSLYLDFVGTGVLPETVTFSRGTNATLTGSNGLIQWAPHNLLTNSESFEAAAWVNNGGTVTANALVAPDGTTTADYLVRSSASADGRYQVITAGTSGVVTASVYIKKDTSPQSLIWLYDATAVADRLFATVTWSGSTPVITATTGTAATPQDAGNGWWRIAITSTALTGANTNRLYLLPAYIAASNGQQTAFWGAQLNVGSTAQSYNPTTPKNLLGFTQEPENAAWTKSNSYVQQNLLTWSQDFDNSAWVDGLFFNHVKPTVAANVAVAPDGSITADQLTSTNATASSIGCAYVTGTTSTTYTVSCWVKAGTTGSATSARLSLAWGSGGTLAGSSFSPAVALTTEWQRVTFSATTAATGVTQVQLNVNLGNGTSGGGVGTTMLVWGAQLVQGSTAGDYTQTTSAAAPTRYLNWDGTLTGRKLVENTAAAQHQILQSQTLTAATYTLTVYAKADQGPQRWLSVYPQGTGVTAAAVFDINAGAVTSTLGAQLIGSSIVSVGGGWFRCSVTFTGAAVSVASVLYLSNASNAASPGYTGDGTSGIYVSDFQLSNSASVDPYVYNPQAAAASAAYYGPRFDYDPVTLAPRGLLIEEQRTNLLTYSEQFDDVTWSKFNSSVTSNATTSPDGTTTADKLIEDTVNTSHSVAKTTAISASTSYSFSVYLKASERSFSRILVGDTGGNNGVRVDVNLATGATSTGVNGTGWTLSSASATLVGNGWYRVTVSGSNTSATTGIVVVYTATGLGTVSYTGDGTSGIFIWGAQLEAGAFPTSYIPTVASQVTRNADSASMLGDNFYTWYNPNQGTTCVETSSIGANSVQFPGVLRFWSGSNNNRFGVYGKPNGAGYGAVMTTAGSNVALLDPISGSTATIINTVSKLAYAYKPDDFAATRNALTVTTDTSGGVAPVNEFNIGLYDDRLNGYIRRIGYYNTRLPNATLQALTV